MVREEVKELFDSLLDYMNEDTIDKSDTEFEMMLQALCDMQPTEEEQEYIYNNGIHHVVEFLKESGFSIEDLLMGCSDSEDYTLED